VFVFSRIALREQRARGRIERLVAELAAANDRLTAHAAQVEQLATAQERRSPRPRRTGCGRADSPAGSAATVATWASRSQPRTRSTAR
jgi:hypothetical protein